MSDEPVQAGDPPSSPVGDPPSHAPRFLLLNAIFPGLGHLAAGRWKWALLLGGPIVVLLLVLVVLAATGNPTALAARMFDPQVLTAILVVEALVVGWRLFAVGATRVITPITARATTVAALAISLLIILGPQLVIAGLTVDARDAATEVFAPVAEGGAWVPTETAPPVESNDANFAVDPSASPDGSLEPSPSPTATAAVPRVNVLLIGMDWGVGRTTALTDTMIVVSLDPVAKTVSMASIPRDMVDVPLPDGRKYRGKINGLVSYARWHPNKFPGSKDGQSVLTAALGTLLGMKIDYWAQVNLGGFVHLVDSVGGVNINVTDGFCDPRYKEYGFKGFNITPGRYHMDGEEALGYARIRKALGESDFTRDGRQQEVIAALRDRLVRGEFLDNPSRFLRSLGQTITTNIKPSLIADYIAVATQVKRDDVFRDVFDHPLVKSGYDARGSIQIPDVKAIRRKAAKLFPPTGTRPSEARFDPLPEPGNGPLRSPSRSSTCGLPPKDNKPDPKPTPKATPKPTPKATPKPSKTPKPTAPPTPEPPPSEGNESPASP